MTKRIRSIALLLCLLLCTSVAVMRGDSIRTKDGQTFIGKVVEETDDHIRIQTKFGEIVIPRKEIRKREPEVETPEQKKSGPKKKKPKKPGARKIQKEHRKAMKDLKAGKYTEAITRYSRILSWQPNDRLALYNMACAQSLSGNKDKALDFLVRSAEAGFVDFDHIERDPDLDGLRKEGRYKELFARREELVQKAMNRAVARISKQLRKRKIDIGAYTTVFDTERNFVYLHARDEEDLKLIRKGLEEYAEYQWKHLFQNKPGEPMYIILLTQKDTPKILGRAGGVYMNRANALMCGDIPAYKLMKASVIIHEFTHALHFADQRVRRQQHPIWLVEGLATLFESSGSGDQKFVPHHNQRLAVLQNYVRSNRTLPWTAIVKLSHSAFMRRAGLCYAQARYMLYYIYEKGLLKKFYDEYTDAAGYRGDTTAQEAFEVVFGKPMAAVESDWKEWVLKQTVPPIPFLGIRSRMKGKRVVVTNVVINSGAEKAGLKKGDVIVALDDTELHSRNDLIEAIGKRGVGDEVDMVIRRGDEELRISALLGPRPSRAETAKASGVGYLGLTVELRDGGLFVREAAPKSPAAEAGITPGTQILELQEKPVESVRDYLRTLKKCKPGDTVKLKIKKTGTEAEVLTVTLSTMP